MFEKARIKLTIWYMVTTLLITGGMSAMIYRGMCGILDQRFALMGGRFRERIEAPMVRERLLDEAEKLTIDLEEIKRNLLVSLLVLNGSVAVVVTIGGYIFAGEVLDPIKKSHEKEKRFVADASHELRTPLTALITGVEVALRNRKISKKEAVEVLEESLEDLERLKNLSNRLLHLSRTEEGEKIIKKPVDLGKSLQLVVKRMRPLAEVKGIKIKVENGGKKKIKVDEELLTELWTILLDNAIKYSKKKGQVWLKVLSSKTGVWVEVEDEGRGMKKNEVEHVFERFYRADEARSKDGFGLGLALAKQIVDRHGGKIEIESKFNQGTKVRVFLPWG